MTTLSGFAAFAVSVFILLPLSTSADVIKSGFHLVLPGSPTNRDTADDVHITFYPGATVKSGSGTGFTTSEFGAPLPANQLNLMGGSVAPGNFFDLTVNLTGARAAGVPIISEVVWTKGGTPIAVASALRGGV